MAWIELHDALRDHAKTYAVMESLKVRRREAVGMLALFWLWALKAAPSGDISAFPARAIADASDWSKSPETLMRALQAAGWIDHTEDGRTVIHDWDDFTWRYFDKVSQTKEQTKKRVAEYRKRKAQLQGNADTVTNVTLDALQNTQCNAPTVPNRTIPYLITTTTTTRADSDPGFASTIQTFTENIHDPTPAEREVLLDIAKIAEPDLIAAVIKAAVADNKRSARYVEVTVRNLVDTGITTLVAYQAHMRDWDDRKRKNTNDRKERDDEQRNQSGPAGAPSLSGFVMAGSEGSAYNDAGTVDHEQHAGG